VDTEETRRHIEEVSARIRAIAPPDLREHLLQAAVVHEQGDPERLPADVAPVVLGFGEVWQPDLDLDAYVNRHQGHLRALLLFELAHEGAATDGMRAVASHARVTGDFAGWERAIG
jgi:hypothetical protein